MCGECHEWLIPRNRALRALFYAAERHLAVYRLTVPLWFGRYHWLVRRLVADLPVAQQGARVKER